jgi:CDP-glucose 4,6-dehydratase
VEGLVVTSPDSSFAGAFRGRRVLVTGHTGFKGAWLVLWLRRLGAQVSGLALPVVPSPLGPGHLDALGLDLPQAMVDLRDAVAVRRALARFQPEVVFHLAAQALVRRGYREPAATFEVNVGGLVNLLEAIRSCGTVRAVVNATSDKCYLNTATRRGYVEDDPLGGHDPYSASKACAELVSASWRASFLAAGAPPVGLATARAGNVIGGGDWAQDRLVPDLARAAIAGRSAPIRHPGATRPWQHVLEPLSGYLALAAGLLADPSDGAEAWNFGPDPSDHLTVGELASRFAARWDAVRVELDRGPHPHEAELLHLDCSKAAARLGWRPVWTADTAIERTADWYRRLHRDRVPASGEDLDRYVEDAVRAGRPWAAARVALPAGTATA